MTQVSWNEVRDRALQFSRRWADATDEAREKQTFWNEFFECFGVPRRSVAIFEHAVANVRGTYGFLDLFWRGVLLVEHKSAGASFSKAQSQAFRYLEDLIRDNRHDELPRYIILCDFKRFALYDLEGHGDEDLPLLDERRRFRIIEFPLPELHHHVRDFAFIKGEKPVRLDPEDPANFRATQLLADLHDALERTGYAGHALERYLVRLLFCLFAEDTGIFDAPSCFTALIERTREDGADLGPLLSQLWDVLNTEVTARQSTLDEDLAAFPWVDGGLYAEHLPTCSFNSQLRSALLACARFHWARISPAVFGSLFQGVLDASERRQLGAHYTSERDILKLLRALLLDDLRAHLDAALADRSSRRTERLREFQRGLRRLRLFDPACGCGNFLILAYRELRRLETEVLVALHGGASVTQRHLDIRQLAEVDVDQFYGIDIGEWPVRIAEVGLWLTDHQCNVELAAALGQRFVRLPLRAAPTLHVANALRTDWRNILPPSDDVLVLGNPPFVGKKEQTADQKADMKRVWDDTRGAGTLDYVTCWYHKAAEYIQGTRIRCAFVSTNSITQGEQVGVLWGELFGQWHLKIHFAHRTFAWQSEARGRAHVHVVIIGFGAFDRAPKFIFEYHRSDAEPTVTTATNINPYLMEGGDTTVRTRTRPVNGAPAISYGSMMIDRDRDDGDHAGLVLTTAHRDALIAESPALEPYIRRMYGGAEFLNGTVRYCLWLVDAPPNLLRSSPLLRERLETVRRFRAGSSRPQTKTLAATPALFGEIRQPSTPYLLIPKVSSESRRYIPIGFVDSRVIASGSALIIPNATMFDFGILSSAMHNAWMRTVAGRMKSDPQYSNNIVYNNFPWPTEMSETRRQSVEAAARGVLEARGAHTGSTMAELYDPLSMPAVLAQSHSALDRAVDRCYRSESFPSDRARVEHLFHLYDQLSAPLLPTATPRRSRRRGS